MQLHFGSYDQLQKAYARCQHCGFEAVAYGRRIGGVKRAADFHEEQQGHTVMYQEEDISWRDGI